MHFYAFTPKNNDRNNRNYQHDDIYTISNRRVRKLLAIITFVLVTLVACHLHASANDNLVEVQTYADCSIAQASITYISSQPGSVVSTQVNPADVIEWDTVQTTQSFDVSVEWSNGQLWQESVTTQRPAECLNQVYLPAITNGGQQ